MSKNLKRLIPGLSFLIVVALVIRYCTVGCCGSTPRQIIYSHLLQGTAMLNYDSVKTNEPAAFEFENIAASTPVTFWCKTANGINYHNAAAMLASVIADTMSNEQKAIAIWRLVTQSGFSHPYDYNHHLSDNVDPIALVRFPYFLCGEKAGITANLTVLAGLPARVVNLDGHVVAEIKYNGTWHLFDSDEGCIFRSPEGQIASVEELHKHPEWLKEENAELIPNAEFYGFDKYKKKIEHYKPDWVDTTAIIANYNFPNNNITLYPHDKVSFLLNPMPWWSRLLHKFFLVSTKGILTRNLNISQPNLQSNNGTIIFSEDFPYYLKLLRISSAEPLQAKVYFQYQNRETLKAEKKYIGQLNSNSVLMQKFDAPATSDIYYRYQLIFENLTAAQAAQIKVEHEFEFNSVTFPLHKAGGKVITTDSIGIKNLTFKISKCL